MPLNEQLPWLVYVVLEVACLILLAILANLALQAIRRHDQVVKPDAESPKHELAP